MSTNTRKLPQEHLKPNYYDFTRMYILILFSIIVYLYLHNKKPWSLFRTTFCPIFTVKLLTEKWWVSRQSHFWTVKLLSPRSHKAYWTWRMLSTINLRSGSKRSIIFDKYLHLFRQYLHKPQRGHHIETFSTEVNVNKV